MKARHIFPLIATAAFLLNIVPALAEDTKAEPLLAFVLGDYVIVGREPHGGAAYSGSARIEPHEDRVIMLRRHGGREVTAEGRLEVPSPPGEGKVLCFRWLDPEPMLMSCLIDGDLDNYARLTCLWARQDSETVEPGLEAMFPKK